MKQLINFSVLLSLVLSLVACGGGGGGGSSSNTSSSMSYSGSTSAANIDSSNAQSIAGDSTTSGAVGGTAGSIATVKTNSQSKKSGTSIISQAIIQAVTTRIASANSTPSLSATVTNNTVSGSCGGTETFSINVDTTTTNFTGSMTFDNYCDSDVIISGSATISGTIDTSITQLTLSMTFNNLLVEDKTKKQTFKAESYTIAISDNYSTSSFSVSLSGKFYHPDYGYVLLTTITPLQYSGTSEWPSSGKIKVTEDGAAPADSATLTALDTTQYQLDLDTGNDGTVDSSTIGNWADL